MDDASGRRVRRADVPWTRLPDGRIEVTRRRFGATGAAVLKAVRVSPDLTVRFDTVGSDAWELLDGTATLGQVHDRLKARHPDVEDLPVRLGKFVSMLVQHRLATLEA